jgi:hypothetical protein
MVVEPKQQHLPAKVGSCSKLQPERCLGAEEEENSRRKILSDIPGL